MTMLFAVTEVVDHRCDVFLFSKLNAGKKKKNVKATISLDAWTRREVYNLVKSMPTTALIKDHHTK